MDKKDKVYRGYIIVFLIVVNIFYQFTQNRIAQLAGTIAIWMVTDYIYRKFIAPKIK